MSYFVCKQRCHESHVDDVKDLISRVLSHYQEYYEEKSRVVKRDVFLVFSPTWFTPLERAFFWIAGFRPGLAFRIVVASVDDMTEDQNRRMRQLMSETNAEERELGNRLASAQESVAGPRGGEIEAVVGALRSTMEAVLGDADSLRTRTAERVVEILSPAQNVRFLAASTQLQKYHLAPYPNLSPYPFILPNPKPFQYLPRCSSVTACSPSSNFFVTITQTCTQRERDGDLPCTVALDWQGVATAEFARCN
ncbi:hypothetical protein Acr_03g0005600 [Actinidia rufa]|uniref:DOG1 domain-containing protein n=1 Tax=Actinidia rufa TaxID=165716 RepID=A0A7J0EC84_9ERIC|nr:hypothetical protein Acr_03g0005600 [Actinidia rufa]